MQKSVVERRLALSRAIERCYDAFVMEPAPVAIEFCDHCHQPECAALLTATVLRELSVAQMRCRTFALLDSMGGPEELRYLVPRMLELLPTGEPHEPELVLAKLAGGGWRDWPTPEQEAVEGFLAAYWEHVLAEFPGHADASEALCAIALVIDDVAPYLAAWTDDVETAALRHLAQLVCRDLGECLHALRPLRLADPWWDDRPAQHDAVLHWLTDVGRETTLEAGAHAETDADVVAELTAAFEVLSLARATDPAGATGTDTDAGA